ncbi:MAG: helix-turn-helix domain-containing protein, partial [Mucilaginibacter sp.]
FVLNGGCVEKKRVSYGCLPGKIQYYSAGEPHQVTQILAASRRINLEIEGGFFKDHQVSDQAIQTATENPDAKFLMIRIYRELMAGDVASPVSIQMLLLQLISHTGTSRPNGQVPLWVNKVRAILHDRWNEKVTLTELSLETNVHPVTISRYFSAYFSCTLGEYMRKIKIEKALCLIKSSTLPLTEIAYVCGFADQSHFIRSFKEFTDCLPTAYQRY